MESNIILLNRVTILGDLVRIESPPHQEMVEGYVATHTIRDPFLFHQTWELILKEVDIARFNLCHATIRVFPIHHIPFRMCGMSHEHLASSRTKFSMFMGWVMYIAN